MTFGHSALPLRLLNGSLNLPHMALNNLWDVDRGAGCTSLTLSNQTWAWTMRQHESFIIDFPIHFGSFFFLNFCHPVRFLYWSFCWTQVWQARVYCGDRMSSFGGDYQLDSTWQVLALPVTHEAHAWVDPYPFLFVIFRLFSKQEESQVGRTDPSFILEPLSLSLSFYSLTWHPWRFTLRCYILRWLFCNVSRNLGSARPCQTSAMGVRAGRSIAIEMKEGSPNMSFSLCVFFFLFFKNYYLAIFHIFFSLFLPFFYFIYWYLFIFFYSFLFNRSFYSSIFFLIDGWAFSWKDICRSTVRLEIHLSGDGTRWEIESISVCTDDPR